MTNGFFLAGYARGVAGRPTARPRRVRNDACLPLGMTAIWLSVFMLALLVLSACKPDGHFLGGYADGAHRAATLYHPHVHGPVYYPPLRLRYYGQPHVDRYDAGRDPWLAENDPWVVQ